MGKGRSGQLAKIAHDAIIWEQTRSIVEDTKRRRNGEVDVQWTLGVISLRNDDNSLAYLKMPE